MKKILFATTALVATAGVAAADVSISGRAAFGLYKQTGNVTYIQSDMDLTFTGTTETDGGVSLSASVDFDDFGNGGVGFGGGTPANAYQKSTAVMADTVFTFSSGALSFQYGDTDGAIDKRTTEVHRILGIDAELWAMGMDNDDDGAIARLDYSFGDIGVSLSYAGLDNTWGIGANWSSDLGSAKVSAGFGYEDSPVGDLWAVSLGADFGAFGARLGYMKGTTVAPAAFTAAGTGALVGTARERLDLSVQYSANGLTVGANWLDDRIGVNDGWTVFGTYDLGGGAQLFAQHGESILVANQERTSMGIAFSF